MISLEYGNMTCAFIFQVPMSPNAKAFSKLIAEPLSTGILFFVIYTYHGRFIKTEQNLSQAESWSTQKSTLLSRINHEVRTPVNIILGTLDMMNCSHCLEDVVLLKTQVPRKIL